MCAAERLPLPPGVSVGRFREVQAFVCSWSWAGTPERPSGEAQGGEGLSVPGNILVHGLVCWVRICHGVLCFWAF